MLLGMMQDGALNVYYRRPTWKSAFFFAHWLASSTGHRFSVKRDHGWGEWIIRRVTL